MAKAKNDNGIADLVQQLCLVGRKLALMKLMNKIRKDIDTSREKLHKIKKKKMFSVLKGDKND